MGNNRQYTDEFRAEAVKQVIERGFSVVDVSTRIGIPKHTLYEWIHKARKAAPAAGGSSERSNAVIVDIGRKHARGILFAEQKDRLWNSKLLF